MILKTSKIILDINLKKYQNRNIKDNVYRLFKQLIKLHKKQKNQNKKILNCPNKQKQKDNGKQNYRIKIKD